MVKRGSEILPDMPGAPSVPSFHIGQKPIKNGAQPRVEIALKGLTGTGRPARRRP